MAKKGGKSAIGGWAFLVGVVLAIVFGVLGMSPTVAYILVILGIIVGLLNIADAEATPFMMSGVVLIIASAFGQSAAGLISYVGEILDALLLIFVPATIVVAVRNVMSLARH